MARDYIGDKSWMYVRPQQRVEDDFVNGVKFFSKFAFEHKPEGSTLILCSCKECENMHWRDKDTVEYHIVRFGFVRDYTCWYFHGESRKRSREEETLVFASRDDMEGMLHDAWGGPIPSEEAEPSDRASRQGRDRNTEKFEEYIKDARKPLYPGCTKYTKLSFFIRLFQIKCLNKWSNKSMSDLLELLKDSYPAENNVPKNWYESKKIMTDLGLEYKKIHACRNDCVLFRKEYERLDSCPVCEASRWKQRKGDGRGKDMPIKILRHFPLIPRLQRLFMNKNTAMEMTWHHRTRREEEKMSHPRDSEAWKDFDRKHPLFSIEPRNVRLGLASDGFSPFKLMTRGNRSTWPVVLMAYNLPPWLAMNQSYFILSLIIDGPRSPGNDIDVYLQPLIDELKTLWEDGINTYDISKGETFKLRAALLWTINDFPAYGMLSGWSTKGYKACPNCHNDHGSIYLPCSRKCIYWRHCRFLPASHVWRNDEKNFDGTVEHAKAPIPLSGEDVLKQWDGYSNVTFGKKSKLSSQPTPAGWKKKSIFFELDYWKTLLVRHNLDVMHIEKNVCDNILNTLLCKDGKTKDNLNARQDLQHLKIREDMHPKPLENKPGRVYIPYASYDMSKEEKDRFLRVLKDLKLPEGFSSNFSEQIQIKEGKIVGLKSHDCHVMMQQLLPLALRTSVSKSVGLVLSEYCTFFIELCSKVIDVRTMEKLEFAIPVILCKLEKIFPSAFFDVMVHLTVHLATEAKLAGPVQYRWMYPIERYLLTLKNYVRNRSWPEGSIAEGHIMEEVITFCARYLDDVETKLNRPLRVQEGPLGKGTMKLLSSRDAYLAHRFVLFNTEAIDKYIELHRDNIKQEHLNCDERKVQLEQHKTFLDWFISHIDALRDQHEPLDDVAASLSRGPIPHVTCYKGFGVNGYKFQIKSVENARVTQNSGVVTVSDNTLFYGVLEDILEIRFVGIMDSIHLFQCSWYDNKEGLGQKIDEYKLLSVNTKRMSFEDKPFIFPVQAQQVYYSKDPVRKDWSVICRWKPRDTYEVPQETLPVQEDSEEEAIEENINAIRLFEQSIPEQGIPLGEGTVDWVRQDLGEGVVVADDELKRAHEGQKKKG